MDFMDDEELLNSAKNAVLQGNVELLGKLLANKTHVFCNKVLYFAIVDGLKGNFVDDERCIEIIKTILNFGADLKFVDRFDCYNTLNDTITSGKSKVVKFFLENGADVNTAYNRLYCAIDNGNEVIVKLLLDYGAKVNGQSIYDIPLGHAAKKGFKGIVKLLLDYGADINGCEDVYVTPLAYAAKEGHEEIVSLLLDHGADINKGSEGSTPITYAAKFSTERVVQLLLDRGAEVNNYALHGALRLGTAETVKILLKSGCDPNCVIESKTPLLLAFERRCFTKLENFTVVKTLLQCGAQVNYRISEDEESALHYAAKRCDVKIIKLLIDHGADVNAKSSETTALMLAVENWLYIQSSEAKMENEKIVELLLDGGAKKESRALAKAIALQGTNIVKLMLQKGFDANCTIQSKTSLTLAVEKGNVDIVKLLLEHGAKANDTRIQHRQSILRYAAEKGSMDIVKVLLEHGANANDAMFEEGQSVLHYAAKTVNEELVKLLLNYGADVDAKFNGRTALRIFIQQQDFSGFLTIEIDRMNEKIIKLLLDYGAARDNLALYDAIKARKTKVVKLLLERGFDANFMVQFKSMLRWAVHYSDYSSSRDGIVKLLLKHGARIDEGKSKGLKTALHYAAEYGYVEMTTTLLNAGADINAEHEKKTPVTLAIGRGRYSYMEVGKLLVRQMMLLRSQDLFVSEVNLNASKGNTQLEEFQNACASEMKILRAEKFDDSNLYYSDILKIKDDCKLAALANNENIVKVMISEGFSLKFPIYGEMIIERFNKASKKRKNLDLIKKFFNYLFVRDHDKLPNLPFTVVSKTFNYLGDDGIAHLKRL